MGACCVYPALADRRRTNPTRRSSRPQTFLHSSRTRRALHRNSPGSLDRDAEANRSPVEELQHGEITIGEPQDTTTDQGQLFSAGAFQDEVPYLDELPNSFNFEVCRILSPTGPPPTAQKGHAKYHDPMQSYSTHLRNSNPSIASAVPDQGRVTNPCSSLPSRAVGLSLLEIYFDRIYNASLLFCKPVLFQEYIEEKLPDYLLKGLFALASL